MPRIEILDTLGEVVNTIDADEAFAEEHYPGAWRLADQQYIPQNSASVPQKVSARQAHQALILAGLYDNVQAAIDAIPDGTQRAMTRAEWDKSNEFERSRPLLIQLAEAIGLDSEALDNLFITAAQL